MSELWYQKHGFFSNPFSIKPAAFHDELIAYDLKIIYKKIDEGQMIFIDGPYGTGKTTILKNIIGTYRGYNRILYHNFNKADVTLNVDRLLAKVTPMYKKVVGLKQTNVILLLDEVSEIKPGLAKEIVEYYRQGVFRSVIMVNHDYYSAKLPVDIEEYLKGNVIRTAKLNTNEAVKIIRKRIGDIDFLPDSIIKKLFMKAGYNPRRLLEYCEDVCKYATEMGDDKVSDEHIDQVVKARDTTPKTRPPKIKIPKVAAPEKIEIPPQPQVTVEPTKAREDLPEYRVVFYESVDKN